MVRVSPNALRRSPVVQILQIPPFMYLTYPRM